MNRCLRFIYKDLPYKSIPRVLTRHDGKNCTPGFSTSFAQWDYIIRKEITDIWHMKALTQARHNVQTGVSGFFPSLWRVSANKSVLCVPFRFSLFASFIKPPFGNHLLVRLEANSDTSPILLVLVLKHLSPLNLIRLLWYNVGIHLCFWNCPRGPCWLLLGFPVEVRRGKEN